MEPTFELNLKSIVELLGDGKQNVKFVDDQDGRGRGLIATKDIKRKHYVALYSKKAIKVDKISSEDIKYSIVTPSNNWFIGKGPAMYINDVCDSKIIYKLKECKTIDEV